MDAKKRKKLDFSTKADIIRRVEAGEKKSSVAKEFGIPRSTLSTILRHKADVKAKAAQCGRSGACRVRAPEYDKVEKALYAWFLETRAKNIPVDGPMLMEKAKWFATALGEDNFTGGTGWQQRFKNRYDIVGKTLSGESGATSSNNSIEKWLSDEWPDICNSFSPSQIFNADETALFWQMLPSKTLDFKGSKCHGGKMSKVRISILLAANMDGSCKLQPFVIGKSRSPRCFKNARGLSVRYASNKKSVDDTRSVHGVAPGMGYRAGEVRPPSLSPSRQLFGPPRRHPTEKHHREIFAGQHYGEAAASRPRHYQSLQGWVQATTGAEAPDEPSFGNRTQS